MNTIRLLKLFLKNISQSSVALYNCYDIIVFVCFFEITVIILYKCILNLTIVGYIYIIYTVFGLYILYLKIMR